MRKLIKNSSFRTTLNRQGFMLTKISDPVTRAFVDFSSKSKKPVLDVGAAFGIVTMAVLQTGAKAIANDLDQRHLDEIYKSASEEQRNRLTLSKAQFPEELDLKSNSLHAILISRVLHFFTGARIISALTKCHDWLAPGGKLFIVADTPWQGMAYPLIEQFKNRENSGELWPGEFQNFKQFVPDDMRDDVPDMMHFLDKKRLRYGLEQSLFKPTNIEIQLIDRKGVYPDSICVDGRESIGAIAKA